jgi:hypothetical protein
MGVSIKSLTGFRRFLAQPGASVQVIRHDWAEREAFKRRADYWDSRTVAKLQTNAVKFSNDSWLHWDQRGGAKEFHFDASNVVTVNLSDNGSFTTIFRYRCWLASEESVLISRSIWEVMWAGLREAGERLTLNEYSAHCDRAKELWHSKYPGVDFSNGRYVCYVEDQMERGVSFPHDLFKITSDDIRFDAARFPHVCARLNGRIDIAA